ncbi:ABC transporter permease [Candidatus Geothermarchaeota archaeon]|nr:MAG: ABC transporter permease [Candidatus Geothermarchaeota archaeon]HEW93754.1 ABC transporter permease [Thermoprotei archaeon]
MGFVIGVLTAFAILMIRDSISLMLAAVGEAYAERSGILNLGIEGMIMLGASIGFVVTYKTGNPYLGFISAGLLTGLLGIIMGIFVISIGTQQHVTTLGFTIIGSGLSVYIYRLSIESVGGVPPTVEGFPRIYIPYLTDIPVIGPSIFGQPVAAYVVVLIVLFLHWIMEYTKLGLHIKAVGDNPKAADTLGVNVFMIRYLAIFIAASTAGMAGAWLSTAHSNMFLPNMSMGRGWIAIALVSFGMWNPLKIILGSLLFGGLDALGSVAQTYGRNIPYQFLQSIPFIVTILVLIPIARRAKVPKALLKPYRREEAE